MTCPYFMPISRLDNGNWPHPARLPLGCGWSGHCTAPGHEGKAPPQDILEAFCNLGYASSCGWAPSERTWDAVRFAVVSPEAASRAAVPEPEAATRTLKLQYVCERDHRPVAHGELIFDLTNSNWVQRHNDARIQKMAECFLESYLKKKSS